MLLNNNFQMNLSHYCRKRHISHLHFLFSLNLKNCELKYATINLKSKIYKRALHNVLQIKVIKKGKSTDGCKNAYTV